MISEQLSRREFMKRAGSFLAAAALSGCSSDTSQPSLPTKTPLPETPMPPTLLPATPEDIDTQVPHVAIRSRQTEFPPYAANREICEQNEINKSSALGLDWFGEVHTLGESLKSPSFGVYYDHKNNTVYSGFGEYGRDHEILGWQTLRIENSGPGFVRGGFFTDIPGVFGYVVSGSKTGDAPQTEPHRAFVFVDIPNKKKTFITYTHGKSSNFLKFEFAVSADAKTVAINQVISMDVPEKGVYLLNPNDWSLRTFVKEHVNGVKISEDGKQIYSTTGSGISSTIIHVDTGEYTSIRWPASSILETYDDIVSPNFKYIARKASLGLRGSNQGQSMFIKTPNGFEKGGLDLVRISNDGVAYYSDGRTVQLPK